MFVKSIKNPYLAIFDVDINFFQTFFQNIIQTEYLYRKGFDVRQTIWWFDWEVILVGSFVIC